MINIFEGLLKRTGLTGRLSSSTISLSSHKTIQMKLFRNFLGTVFLGLASGSATCVTSVHPVKRFTIIATALSLALGGVAIAKPAFAQKHIPGVEDLPRDKPKTIPGPEELPHDPPKPCTYPGAEPLEYSTQVKKMPGPEVLPGDGRCEHQAPSIEETQIEWDRAHCYGLKPCPSLPEEPDEGVKLEPLLDY